MAGSVNKVIILGNLGKDPEVRSFANGGKVVNFSVATSETWKDKATGERKERTEWHRVSIMNEGIAGVAEKYLKKGSKVYIEGQLETRKWLDQAGVEKYTTEIVLRPYRGELTLLDGRDGGADSSAAGGGGAGGYGGQSQGKSGGAPAGGAYDDMSDTIPFACEWRL